jgi:hypothetical protein
MVNIDQDTFNKMLTLITLVFVMILYTWSWVSGKPLDMAGLSAFLFPLLIHVTHLTSNAVNKKTEVSKIAVTKDIVNGGVAHDTQQQ